MAEDSAQKGGKPIGKCRALLSLLRVLGATALFVLTVLAAVGTPVFLYRTANSGPPGPVILNADGDVVPSVYDEVPACLVDVLDKRSRDEMSFCTKYCDDKPAAAGTSFRGRSLANRKFDNVPLQNADFACTSLAHVQFRGGSLIRADFTCAEIRNSTFAVDMAQNIRFVGARLFDSTIKGGNYFTADFTCARLVSTDLKELEMNAASFRGSLIDGGSLAKSTLDDVNIDHAVVAPDDAPKLLSAIDGKQWATLIPRDVRLVSDGGSNTRRFVTDDVPRDADVVMRPLYTLAEALEDQGQSGFAADLRRRIRSFELLWLEKDVELARDAYGSIVSWAKLGFVRAYYWITSNGEAKWRIWLGLTVLWGIGAIYFMARLRYLRNKRDDDFSIKLAVESDGMVDDLPLRPELAGSVRWGAYLSFSAILVGLPQREKIRGWADIVFRNWSAAKFSGADRFVNRSISVLALAVAGLYALALLLS